MNKPAKLRVAAKANSVCKLTVTLMSAWLTSLDAKTYKETVCVCLLFLALQLYCILYVHKSSHNFRDLKVEEKKQYKLQKSSKNKG